MPVRSPALLTVGSLLLRGETVNLSRTGACIAVTGPEGLAVGDQGIVSVQGWVEDRAAEVVDISPGQVRLAFFGSRKR
ncbi:PilZ domain-containing protein [Aerophototrophica crusticola]|uniref:PilZ domain-containing protein n=1 Tax=Aerophototrophica crusticola TaxID=1709002 RepID=A0A858R9Y7_9PROT|nr:PilZ domain-containing protein [Rhodospirillaceae bacterium B3]